MLPKLALFSWYLAATGAPPRPSEERHSVTALCWLMGLNGGNGEGMQGTSAQLTDGDNSLSRLRAIGGFFPSSQGENISLNHAAWQQGWVKNSWAEGMLPQLRAPLEAVRTGKEMAAQLGAHWGAGSLGRRRCELNHSWMLPANPAALRASEISAGLRIA